MSETEKEEPTIQEVLDKADIEASASKVKVCKPCDIASALFLSLNVCNILKDGGIDCSKLETMLLEPEKYLLSEASDEIDVLSDTATGREKQQLQLLSRIIEQAIAPEEPKWQKPSQ